MTDLNTVQSNAPVPSEAPTPSTPTPTLDDIAREFPIEEQARNFTAQPNYAPQPVIQPPAFHAPDPVTDPEGHKAFVHSQIMKNQQIESYIRDVGSKVSQWEQKMAQERLNADVDRAVARVNGKLKVDPQLAEAALEVEYKRNPTFQRIWDNRDKNPQAFQKALDVLSDKLAPMFQVRQDPQLAENVRAAQSSQRTMATTTHVKNEAPEDPREFAQWWERQRRGY
jgi:hypothetical protein